MAKKKQKKPAERIDRRTHCSSDTLPTKLQIVVRRMILNKEWPDDFKVHYNGFPRYLDIVQYCKEHGHIISKSAIGRFALQIQKTSHIKMTERVRSFALAHLGEACETFREYQTDRLENTIHPERNCNPEKRIEFLDKLIAEQFDYIEQLIADIRSMN